MARFVGLVLVLLSGAAQAATPAQLDVQWPERRLWVGADGVSDIVIRAVDEAGNPVTLSGPASVTGLSLSDAVAMEGGVLELSDARIEAADITVEVGELSGRFEVPVLPAWLSLAPAVLAIALALLTRQVVLSLVGGIYCGVLLLGADPIRGFARVFDVLVRSAADADHTKIMMFTLLMGGMVGIITVTGGTAGIVKALVKYAKTPRSASLSTWGMGMLVFFDDYASSLLVGNTMRPVTDGLKISREKLAYIVDSTAAPISSVAIVSTWIGYEVSVLAESMQASGIERDAYEVFISGLPSRFYQILSLGFVAMVAWMGRDFGPMLQAERRARRGEGLLREGASPLMDESVLTGGAEGQEAEPRAWLAFAPIAILIGVAFTVLMVTGLSAASTDPTGYAAARADGFLRTFGFILGNSASYDALLYGAGAGVLSAMVLAGLAGAIKLSPAFEAMTRGIQAMMLAILTLVLAWSIGAVMTDLQAGAYVSGALSGSLPLWSIPSLAFVLAALIASATGTSWGTMAVLFPVVIPLVAAAAGAPETESVFMATASAILGGAVFGDHCSPISDTTVLSSIACASDHVDHTKTQAPYALTLGAVSIVIGYIPAGLGMSPWISLLISFAILWAVLRFFGKSPEVSQTAEVRA
ncbi:MAG: Na+/H+ antiporter NhaC family protein [Myxococcota bacterium]